MHAGPLSKAEKEFFNCIREEKRIEVGSQAFHDLWIDVYTAVLGAARKGPSSSAAAIVPVYPLPAGCEPQPPPLPPSDEAAPQH